MKTLLENTIARRMAPILLFCATMAGLTPHAEAAGWVILNRYWMGYSFDNGDWQFLYNDGRVKGTGSYRKRGNVWSHFYGHSSTKSYVRQPGEWFYRNTIYGTPGPRIYPSR